MTVIKKKYASFAATGFFLLLPVLLIQVWASNNVAAYGAKLEQLSQQAQGLSLENQLLENEIAKYQSLKNIASFSAELGLTKAQSIQYIR